MRSAASFRRHVLKGTIAGALVLGLGGRAGMALLSAFTPLPLGLTLRGTLTVILTGALYGAAGGALRWAARRRLPRPAWLRMLVVGSVYFAIVAGISIANNQAGAALLYPALSVGVFWPLFLTWGAWIEKT